MLSLLLRSSSAALLLGPVLLASVAGGCGPSQTATICDALCTCTPCTDNDRADCKDSADAAEQKALGACAAPFQVYLTCAEDNVRCRDPQAINTRCIAEITALIGCDPAVAIIGTPCATAPIKTAICLGTPPSMGGAQSTCAGQQACTAQCLIAAPCNQVKDVFSSLPSGTGQPLLDCYSACSQTSGS